MSASRDADDSDGFDALVGSRPRVDKPEPPSRFEAAVLSLFRGEGRTSLTAGLLLLASLAFTVTFAWLSIDQAVVNRDLDRRGQFASVRVVRTNYDQRDKTFNVAYLTGPTGRRALVDRFGSRPATGSAFRVRYNPQNPAVLLDAAIPVWRWRDFTGLIPAMIGTVVVAAQWPRFRRRLCQNRTSASR